jgi:thiamine-phosphate pyrophosphorylase
LIEAGTLKGFPYPPAKDSDGQSPTPSTRTAGAPVVPRLYIITDRNATSGRPLVEVVAQALTGIAGSGLPPENVGIQLREKDLGGQALTSLARQLRTVTTAAGARLFINDRIDVALAVGADGVHLSSKSLEPADAQRVAPRLALGISTHQTRELREAGHLVDFAVFGPVRETPSKSAYGPPVGLPALAEAARVGPPILALGGIGAGDVADVLAAGASGVACIRAVMAAPDPAEAVRTLGQALGHATVRVPYRT